jgi:hypothetical protein
MPFEMKGSPLKAIGDKTTGTVKVEGVTKRITYQDPPSSARTNTIGTVQGPTTPRGFTIPTIADTTPVETKPKAKTTTPSSAPRQNKVTGNAFEKAASKLGVTNLQKQKVSLENKGGVGTEIKTASASKLSSDLTKKTAAKSTKSTETPKSRKEMKVDKMANKVSDAPKSRKEMRLAKTKNKAAKVKSDYNAGSKGPMEGKAARAKHDRLNKRADRIEERIAKKNKK